MVNLHANSIQISSSLKLQMDKNAVSLVKENDPNGHARAEKRDIPFILLQFKTCTHILLSPKRKRRADEFGMHQFVS